MNPIQATVGDSLGNAGQCCQTIEHGGTVFEFVYPCPATIARLEQLVAKTALANVAELATALEPQAYAELKNDVMGKIQAKKHAFGGELFFQVTSTPDGPAMFLWSYLRPNSTFTLEQIRELMQERADDCARVALMLTPDFCRAAGKLRNLPAALIDRVVRVTEEAAQRAMTMTGFTRS